MKKFLLIITFILASVSFGFSQNCIEVATASFTVDPNTGTFNFNVSYTANGKKALRIVITCGASTVLLDTCYETNGSGATSFTGLECAAGVNGLRATLTPHTGNCSAAACGPDVTVPDGGPLPINMGAFYAKRKNASISLTWQTASEINAKEFILQRKVGNEFVDVTTIAARNQATGSSYAFTDLNGFKGVSQYRLKLVDQDGSFRYSEIRAVKGTGGVDDFIVFPNPSRGNARVTVTDISEPTDVQLIDNSGRILKVVSMNNSNTADFNNLQKGMYLIRILNKNSGESLTKKLNVIE